MWKYPNCLNNCPPPFAKKISLFSRGGGQLLGIFMNFHFFDSRPFQMSSSELKLYFITYYRPLVYFEVFSIYLSVFHEFMWSPKPQTKISKNFWGLRKAIRWWKKKLMQNAQWEKSFFYMYYSTKQLNFFCVILKQKQCEISVLYDIVQNQKYICLRCFAKQTEV